MKLDIADVAFQGFRLVWKKPLVLLAWALFYVVAIIVLIVGAALIVIVANGGNEAAWDDPGKIWFAFLFFVVGFLVLGAVLLCAAYRMVLRPEAGAWAYLRLGLTELRMTGLLLALIVIAIVVALLLSLIMGMFVMILFGGSPSGGAVGSVVTSLIVWALIAFLSVRFSLAGVVNFAEGRFGLSDSWDLTRGNFWRLFAIYLILLVWLIGISLLGAFIGGVVQQALGMPNPWAALMPAGTAATPAEVTPVNQLTGSLVVLGINVVLSAANTMILYAPHAAAYRALTRPAPEATSDVFS